jgi:fermentation-respiration switch protein FrsA (DUF1100 family)
MGGAIAYSLGFEYCCRDPRVGAVLDFSQPPIPLRAGDDPPQAFDAGTGTPVLFINGDQDEYTPPALFAAAYTTASVVVAATIAFLDATIGRQPARTLVDHLRRDVASTRNLATLVYAP